MDIFTVVQTDFIFKVYLVSVQQQTKQLIHVTVDDVLILVHWPVSLLSIILTIPKSLKDALQLG